MEHLIVGYDNSLAAQGALRWAVHHAGRTRARLVVVYVISSAWEWELAVVQVDADRVRRQFDELLAGSWTDVVRTAGIPYETEVSVGRPAEVLLAAARRHEASLVVLGMTGRGTLGELVLGSTGRQVAHSAARPIVTIPERWVPPTGEGPATR